MTAVLLLFELTGSYEVIVPIMAAVATAIFLSRRLVRFGLYHQALRNLGGPAFEMWSEGSLAGLTVREVLHADVETLPESLPYREVLRRVSRSSHSIFPVVRADGTMLGVVRLVDLRPYMLDGSDIPVVAAELAVEQVPLITPASPLDDVARALGELEWDELPVVTSEVVPEPCGVVTRHEVLRRAVATAGNR
jgi:CIC family chloride channel protein